jgi:hypothetical protein
MARLSDDAVAALLDLFDVLDVGDLTGSVTFTVHSVGGAARTYDFGINAQRVEIKGREFADNRRR